MASTESFDQFGFLSLSGEESDTESEVEDDLPMEERLSIAKYKATECEAAIHGSRIPNSLGEMVHQVATIHGIRHHYGFAQELRGLTPEFTRALNARDIMSGIIPTISQPEETPYCIWYPEIPKEETLRALVQRYPDMLYHAARTCAVAGYFELYKELDPMPEVHVAEEAGYASIQAGNSGSRQIFEHIMSQPFKFEIMNDYTRTVNVSGRRVSFLNQDTAVYSSLTNRTKYYGPSDPRGSIMMKPWDVWGRVVPFYFNITEDCGIDDHGCDAPPPPEDYVPLMYSPLPADLPFINKDKLIRLAAYNGDIDRYARLRRQLRLDDEWAFVVRGIYHSPLFAKYWDTQVAERPETKDDISIRRAINARRIMSNDLAWLTPDTPAKFLPELIWYPGLAHSSTYERLARMRPDMLIYCLRSAIVADDSSLWDDLLNVADEISKPIRDSSEPEDSKFSWLAKHTDQGLWVEATESPNTHFKESISAAIPDAADNFPLYGGGSDHWSDFITARGLYFPDRDRLVRLDNPVIPHEDSRGPYNGMYCEVGDIDTALFLRDAISMDTWKKVVENEGNRQPCLERIWEILDSMQAAK